MSIISDNVIFSYRNNPVLKGLTFEVSDGAVTFLAGNNGSGKTTWILNAVDLLRRESGEITYNGQDFSKTRPRVSVAFDTTPIYPTMSVKDNLYILFQVDADKYENRKMLNDMGITDRMIAKSAGKLSYGQTHRVGIAGTLLREADYYILDEPDLGLDPGAWKMVAEVILKRRSEGKAILITGQNYPLFQEIIDRIVVLSDGKSLYSGDVKEFLNKWGDESGNLKCAFEKCTGETADA